MHLSFLVLTSSATLASEGASPWFRTNETSVRLISAVTTIGNDNKINLGLHFKLKEGWKVYWRSPGDAGFPPSLDWQRSKNLVRTDFRWPLPTRFSVSGIQTLGYKKEVIFPIIATVKNINQKLELRADLSYLTCNEICIPYKTRFALDISAGKASNNLSENYRLINQYTAKIPGNGKDQNLTITSVVVKGPLVETEKNVRKGFIIIKTRSAIPFTDPDIYLEGPKLTFFGAPRATLNNDKLAATFSVPVTVEENARIIASNVRLTLKDGQRSAERSLKVILQQTSKLTEASKLSLPLILSFALLGGLILNLMPCVLPVISLKILSILSHAGANLRVVRISFIASALGIVFSFLIIGIGLIGFKMAGTAIGWGIQFQHHWFIVGLSIIVALFAYNLWDIFQINLPSWLNDYFGLSENSVITQNNFSKNFIIGAFATILATPCSAPFLGTAIGFALAGNFSDILAVFFTLGLGMAMPYLIISAFPSFADRLPRPGVWMITIKRILGIALAITAFWLLSILAIQVSTIAALFVGILIILIGLILMARARLKRNYRRLTGTGITLAVLGAFWIPYNIQPSAVQNQKGSHWQPFKPELIRELVDQGKTVFVDITAEWCITCKVNKATVLRNQKVKALLASNNIIAMQGDWTKPDEKILSYLRRFNRYGIPFNAVFGPKMASGEILPELLTTRMVFRSIKKASNRKLKTDYRP